MHIKFFLFFFFSWLIVYIISHTSCFKEKLIDFNSRIFQLLLMASLILPLLTKFILGTQLPRIYNKYMHLKKWVSHLFLLAWQIKAEMNDQKPLVCDFNQQVLVNMVIKSRLESSVLWKRLSNEQKKLVWENK